MPTPKKLKRKAPMSIMQQFGDNERGRSLQREGQRRPGASRSAGDEANMRKYRTMRYVEGERSQGRRASYEQGGRVSGGDAAIRRAMREMGFDPGDQLDVPSQSFLDEKGMTQDEFMDAVFERARELNVYPVRSLGAGRVDSGRPRPQMRGEGERTMSREARGGMGASATEDLLERLSQYKRNAYGNKYEQGGMVAKKKGSTIKIAGQYAVDSIKTTPEGNQYVSMELPDGKVVPVFGDWETYGNPDQEGRIEDLDFRIYPLGDGTYALDAAEAEAEMLRDESRGVAREAGPNVEDLLQELNQRGGMGFTPSGRMRPVKRQ